MASMTTPVVSTRTAARTVGKPDPQCLEAVDLARAAAEEEADDFGVGEHLGFVVEGDRVVSHLFDCPHPGYHGWRWSVTVARASRSRNVTLDEVVLLPGDHALHTPGWVPWSERTEPADLTPGMLAPRPNDDLRLEPGFTGGELAADTEPAELSQIRVVVAELGLGRERVLSRYGRDEAVDRWLDGTSGPDNSMTKQAPAHCDSCGFLVRLSGSMGILFGACTNAFSPSDGAVVSIDHGCGAHSDVMAQLEHLPLLPVWDTVTLDEASTLFD